MTNKEFDKIFRDKLSGHRTPVDGGMWHSIESSLSGGKSVPFGSLDRSGTAGKWRRAAAYVAAVAAVIVIAVLITTENKTHLPIKTIDAGLSKLVAQTASQTASQAASAEPAQAQAPVLQPEKTMSVADLPTLADKTEEPQTTEEFLESQKPEQSERSDMSEKSEASGVVSETAEVSNAAGESHAAEVPVMAGLQLVADDYRGTIERKVRSFSLFSNVAPRTDITAFSNHYGVMASSGISHSSSVLQSMEIISQAKHSLPLNLGVQVQFELGEKISAGVGLSYTWLRSRYEALINKKFHNVKQSLHYIGVPVNFYFTIMQKNTLKFYANVGGAVEKGLRASYHLKSYDGTSLSAKADIDGFQYSANFGLGLEYRFSNPCGIYLEPNAVYFFDSKVPASVRTDQPFQLKAEVGFRFHL